MSSGSYIPRFAAPIAAPIESLPQTLPALLDDPGDAIEARFTGTASVHCQDQVAREAWQQVSMLRRMMSEVESAPGAVLSAPSRFDALPTTADDEVALSHFAVVVVRVTALDWFWFGPGDMRRAFIHWADSGHSAEWVVP